MSESSASPKCAGVSCRSSDTGRWTALLSVAVAWFVIGLMSASSACGSDHADPIDPFNRERLEGGITDLFVFPVTRDDKPVVPFERKAGVQLAPSDPLTDIVREPLTAEQLKEIDAVVFILCVRRQLTQAGSLKLEPYTYRIHIDVDSAVDVPGADDLKKEKETYAHVSDPGGVGYNARPGDKGQERPTLLESFVRYGGRVITPSEINEEITMEFRLKNDATFQDDSPRYSGPAAAGWKNSEISRAAGVFDDPFIFPAFFGTNVVAMAVRVPRDLLPQTGSFLIWATSHEGDRQIDHVGRSLRTQNPRFELLNTLHPSEHVRAIEEERENPSLMRDLFLRFNFAQEFAYRSWDLAPDVMCYTPSYPVGYPNGRLLTDDVAAMLAQYGDTLLYELSWQNGNGRWPRQQTNDKTVDARAAGRFKPNFPFLLEPHPEKDPPPPLQLTAASMWKLLGIAAMLLLLLAIENVIVAKLYHRFKLRKRYL